MKRVAIACVLLALLSVALWTLLPLRGRDTDSIDSRALEQEQRSPPKRPPGMAGASQPASTPPHLRDPELETDSAHRVVGGEDHADDWKVGQLHRLLGGAPPDGLSGTLLRGREPLSAAVVRVERGPLADRLTDPNHKRTQYWQAQPDATGTFLIPRLEPGKYRIEITVGGTQAWLLEASVGKEVLRPVVVFGTGSIRGRLYDFEGKRVPFAAIHLTCPSASPAHDVTIVRETLSDGSYIFDQLAPGTAWLTAYLGESRQDRSLQRSRQVEIRAKASVEADLGSSIPATHCYGKLLTKAGDRLRGPGTISFETHLPRGEWVYARLEADGTYSARLPVGRYHAVVHADDGSRPPTPSARELVVPRRGGELDMLVQGARVTVRLDRRGNRSAGRPQRIELHAASDRVATKYSLERATGPFEFHAVLPGTYGVLAPEGALLGPAGLPLKVHIRATDVELDYIAHARAK